MKRSSFFEGAFFATTGIVICKIIGALYVIPFYAMIGEQGGALYGYAYAIYAVFISFSTGGIPLAISKLVSEYRALGYQHTKEKVYKLGIMMIGLFGFLLFLILFLFAPMIATLILGNAKGGNTVTDIAFAIRVISTSLLVVPVLAVVRGYFQGHNLMRQSSVSSILEQLGRVTVILVGSYFSLKVFHLSIRTAVGVSVFGATIGALVGYFYLIEKKHKKKILSYDGPINAAEKNFTNSFLIRKILIYALPFLIIEGVKAAFSLVDTFTLVQTLVKLNYSAVDAELIQSIVTTWGIKLNMIVISISLGITVSIVPHISSSVARKDKVEANKKIHQSVLSLALFVLPLAFGLSFLSTPMWTLFYGKNELASSLFQFFIFATVSFSFFSLLINICQTMDHTKLVMKVLFYMFLGKVIMNVPSMYIFSYFNIPPYFGPLFITITSELLGALYLIFYLHKNDYSTKRTVYYCIMTLLCSLIMFVTLKIIGSFLLYTGESRFLSLITILLYGVLGMILYFILVLKSGILRELFGKENLKKKMNLFTRNR